VWCCPCGVSVVPPGGQHHAARAQEQAAPESTGASSTRARVHREACDAHRFMLVFELVTASSVIVDAIAFQESRSWDVDLGRLASSTSGGGGGG
jgi:hypothetical protein